MAENKAGIGGIILTAIIGALVGIIMTMTFFTARDAACMAQTAQVEISGMKSEIVNIKETYKEIKADLKTVIAELRSGNNAQTKMPRM